MGAGRREVGNEKGKQVMLPTSEAENGLEKYLILDEGCTQTTHTSCPAVVIPAEIVERILSLLPPPVIFKFRCVCKAWNKLLSSPSFLKTCRPEPLCRPIFFFFTDDWNRRVAAYRFESKKWFKFPFSCVPHLTDVRASAGNLVLCGNLVAKADGFVEDGYVVCNPISKLWIQLPQPPSQHKSATSPVMAMKHLGDPSSSSFHVTQSITVEDDRHLGGNSHFTLLQVYSSDTKQWISAGRIWHTVLISMVWCNDILYCLNSLRHLFFSTTLDSLHWQSVQLPIVKEPSMLLEWNGRVILLSFRVFSNKLRVWMLDTQIPYSWIHLGQTRAIAELGSPVVCGDVIVFISKRDVEAKVDLVTFNLRDKRWRAIERCPFIERTGDNVSFPSSWSCIPSLHSPF
ncbi:F-box/kelch-repeat protein At3g61590 [Physcomitrium patens]|uniref:F-box domain-containing protein n=1 Tax=Physcomitrium patens TaxID=3218 RepID=A0A2K1ITU9_PHYPA|nr:F-box/kelch-repeat protein At3g61590-like [Physcomitrium patens]XP_024358077.1 F-box/kelch-repeat protein At3g61590-like [Physcomitrium patens]PNR32701.1 hypothetical protein PHYPA_024643 [Physcomitrium patens]|eukprot:XP_024358076.1 F-box/kelch-repeat protein At3g61590-like [Physcomitrella patens]